MHLEKINLENIKTNQHEIEEKRVILKSKPLRLGIILNNTCNLDCIMCPDGRHRGTEVLPRVCFDKIYELLPYIVEINWQGGEIFFVKYLKDEFKRISLYRHIHHGIVTNGLLLDEDWIELLCEMDISLTFSIDSVKKETYELIRRGGKFEDLIEKINLINTIEKKYQRRINKSIYVVIMGSNYRELELFIDFARRYGFNRISFCPVRYLKSKEDIFSNLTKDISDYIVASLGRILSLATRYNLEVSIENIPGIVLKERMKKADCKEPGICSGCSLFCLFPWRNIWIDATRKGNIYPDCFCSKPIGNIYVDDLLSVWNSDNMQEYRKRIIDNDWEICNPDCKNRTLSIYDNF